MKTRAVVSLLWITAAILPTVQAVADEMNPALRQVTRQKDSDTVTDWEQGIIEVTGRGVARPSGNVMQDEMLAVEAARAVAYARLAERVGSVRVTSSATIGGSVASGRVIETQVQAAVSGARETGRRVWPQEGGGRAAELTLQLCLTAAGKGCAGAVTPITAVVAPEPPLVPLPVPRPPQASTAPPLPPSPPIKQPPAPAIVAPAGYSGLVISVGKMPFLPVLRPEVVTPDGTVVFNAAKVSRQVVANDGAAQYAGSLADARKRLQAGANPLVLNAVKITDDNRIVISEADAKTIGAANAAAGDFLKNGRVIIVLES